MDHSFLVRFPTPDEEERSHRFTVHRHYLESYQLFVETVYGAHADQARRLVEAQRALPAFGRIQRAVAARPAELQRLLAISWASEMQLRMAGIGVTDFLRYSNAWAPVQAYYAVYMSLHAWLNVSGTTGIVDDHTRSLRSAVAQVVERALLPHPFDVTCTGCPDLRERVIHGAPAGANIDDHFENLAAPTMSDFYPRLAKMLETTRANRLDRLRKEWLRQQGRMRMPAHAKRSQAERLHSTSVFDYLWRLRIRSNYGDVSSILLSGTEDAGHRRFHAGLMTITSSLCLMLQALIVAKTGPEIYARYSAEFLRGGGVELGPPARFLHHRSELLARDRS